MSAGCTAAGHLMNIDSTKTQIRQFWSGSEFDVSCNWFIHSEIQNLMNVMYMHHNDDSHNRF